LVARRDAGDAPPWDCIVRTDAWDIVHAYGTAIEGWVVLATRRHLTALADLDDTEVAELGPLVRGVSIALRDELGCVKTYVAQFAEAADHPHVHVHVVPRFAGQPPERRGPAVFSALGVDAADCVPEARMNAIAHALRARLLHDETVRALTR
jgi:diadenosine tetraphosphate (Ap4A) HIT family hydrolase